MSRRNKKDDDDEDRLPREFLIYRNGEASRPVEFVFIPSKHKTWDSLLEDIEKSVPPIDRDDRIEYLYTPRGRKKNRIRDLDHLQGTITDQLVACGKDGFIEIDGGYERLKDLPPSDLSGSDSDSGSSVDSRGRKKPKKKSHKGSGGYGGSGKNGKGGKDLIIFLFQNGKKYRATTKVFYPAQLSKGLDFIIEEIGRYYRGKEIDGLFTMDGHEVKDVSDLKMHGAYIIVFRGEKFSDSTNYYMPEDAKDTSADVDSDYDYGDYENHGRKSRSPSPRRETKRRDSKRRDSRSRRSGSRSKRR